MLTAGRGHLDPCGDLWEDPLDSPSSERDSSPKMTESRLGSRRRASVRGRRGPLWRGQEVDSFAYLKTPPDVARRRAMVAAATTIGALTMSRIVTDSELSAGILRDAKKQL